MPLERILCLPFIEWIVCDDTIFMALFCVLQNPPKAAAVKQIHQKFAQIIVQIANKTSKFN